MVFFCIRENITPIGDGNFEPNRMTFRDLDEIRENITPIGDGNTPTTYPDAFIWRRYKREYNSDRRRKL